MSPFSQSVFGEGGSVVMSIPAYPLPSAAEPPDSAPLGPGRLACAIAFGVVLPVVCLALDPVVFRSSNALLSPIGSPVLGAYRVVGYSAAAIGMASLLIWLVLQRSAGLMTGLLAGGAAFALGLGVVLLPFTLIGLFVVVGALGLVPFGTAWVFARQAQAAWRAAAAYRAATAWAAAGFVVACGLPWMLQALTWEAVRSATELAASNDPGEAERGVEQFSRLWFATDADDLAWAFARERNSDRRQRLADAYRRVTGGDVERRLAILRD
jgi:hypothetical protein